MLSITLFGAPAIAWQDEPFDLRRRQARALLYYLAAEPQTAPRDRLQFLLWPDVPEAKARRNLTRLLSYLRGALPQDGLLRASPAGIAVDRDRIWCDAFAFTSLCAAGETAELEQAVALAGGAFLDGFYLDDSPEFELWLGQRRRQYERAYLGALRRLTEAKQGEGDLEAAIAHARRYLAEDELAEDAHRRLIGLYAAAGERAAAQRQYEECVAVLERELGVAPLPETRAVYEAAMVAAPGSVAIAGGPGEIEPVWTTLPSLEMPLVGREEAWQQLAEAYRARKEGGAIFIAGEPGIGKSRLLQEFATAQDDRWVLTGHSQEATQDLPYQPIVQALRQALARPAQWGEIQPIWLGEATRILPELGPQFPGLPEPLNVEPQQAQARLFEAVSQICLGLAAQQPLLLCLDDLHWADEGTLGWLNSLSGRLAGSGLCLLATYRAEEGEPLAGLLAALSRAGARDAITLSGLSPAAVTEILAQLPESVPDAPSLAAKIQHATAGNPYFTLETIRTLWEQGQLATPPAALPLPGTVQEAIRGRLGRVSAVARQVLDAAAVLSPALAFELLQPTAGRSEPELEDGAEELVAHQILLDEPAGLRFQHDLFRAVVYEELSHWRRRRLHRRAAGALAAAYSRDADAVAGQVAHHYDAAGEAAPAAQWHARAAGAAQRQYANQEAIHHLRRALALLADAPEDRRLATALYESLGDSLVVDGKMQEADAAYRAALERCPGDERLWRATLHQKMVHIYPQQARLEESDAIYEEALRDLGLDPGDLPDGDWWRTWLDVQLSRYETLYFQGRTAQMEQLAVQIEPALEQFGTSLHHVDYYGRQIMLIYRQKRFRLDAEDVAYSAKAAELIPTIDDEMKRAYLEFGLGFANLMAGLPIQATEQLHRALSRAETTAYLPMQNQCLAYLAVAARLDGDVAQARLYQARCIVVAQRVGAPYYVGVAEANQAWLDYGDGKPERAVAGARKALQRWEGYAYPFHWLAHWPLLAISLARNDLAAAVDSATAMLDPSQQQLPDGLTSALEGAVSRWQHGIHDAAGQMLSEAVALAKAANYL